MASSFRRIELFFVLTVCQLLLVRCNEPRLVISPPQSSLFAPAGKTYGLQCQGEAEDAEDGAFTEMKWLNPRGEIIGTGTPGVKEYGQNVLKLSFVTPEVDDSGSYKCTALYGNTKTLEQEVQLNFYDDIKFEDCEIVQNLVVGKEGKINCRPVGNPQPSINWEKNKRRVKSERVAVTSSGIVINTVALDDAGVYTVEAFVPQTGTNKYRDITVNVLTPPKIIELPDNFVAIQGEEYTITCRADGSEPLAYTWFDPQLRDLSEVDGFKVNGGLLTVYHVDKYAGGEYKCKVSNPAGEDEETLKLEVHVRPSIVQFENVTRKEGENAAMECKAEGMPKPTLTIRKDNSYQTLHDGQEERIEMEELDEGDFKILRFRIIGVKRSDDGLYYCKASNAAGDAEKAGHIEVQFKPDMSLTPTTSVKAWSPNPANLSCIAEANPNATIVWKFQNELIDKADDRYKIYGGTSYSSLLVKTDNQGRYEVFGVYTCEASNTLGDNSININLEEATAPGQVTQIVFDKVTSTTITFRLMGPGNTGGLPIIKYVMKYKIANEPDETTVDWIKDAPYILSNLKPRAEYHFSVAARNVVGEGPWQSAEYIMPEETVPESPAIITEQETISSYPDRFEVRWEVPNDNGERITQFEVRYFKVERSIKGWTQADKAVESSIRDWEHMPSYELTGLQPETYYKIEIRASNKIGNSLPESVVIRTTRAAAGDVVNDGQTSMLDEELLSLPIIIAIVLVAVIVILVILDITCFFRFHCGLLYLMRYRTCGRSQEKIQGNVEDGRACVKEVSTANNGKVKLPSPTSPDQLPPPDKISQYEEKPKHEVDNLAFENGNTRPADIIIDENFKNRSPKGSKNSIGKSSPV